jgi:hypothetical protein
MLSVTFVHITFLFSYPLLRYFPERASVETTLSQACPGSLYPDPHSSLQILLSVFQSLFCFRTASVILLVGGVALVPRVTLGVRVGLRVCVGSGCGSGSGVLIFMKRSGSGCVSGGCVVLLLRKGVAVGVLAVVVWYCCYEKEWQWVW